MNNIQQIVEQIQGRIQDGRILIDEQSGIAELSDVLALLPGRHLALSEAVFQRTESSLSLSGRWTGEWQLAAGQRSLALTGLEMKLTVSPSQIQCVVEGQTIFGEGTYQIEAAFGEDAVLSIEMEPTPDNPPIGFADVSALFGSQDALAPLSEALGTLGFDGVRLGRLALGVDLSALKATRIDVGVELYLRDVALVGYLGYPDLWIGGGLMPGTRVDLPGLVKQLGVDATGLPPLAVSELAFKIAAERKELVLAARFDNDWRIGVGDTSIALTALELDLGASVAGVHAKIDAWAELGAALCVASLTLPSLELTLGLAPGHSLALTELFEALVPGDALLPKGAPALRLTELRLDARPQQKTFSLTARMDEMWPLPFGNGLAIGKLALSLAMEASRASGSFAGTVVLGGTELTAMLKLQRGGGSVSLSQGPAALDLTAFIAGLVPESIEIPAEIGGLECLTLTGLAGSFDFATRKYELRAGANLDRLTLGALEVSHATGSVEVAGTGATLTQLVVKIGASFGKELVPGLDVDSVSFVLELTRVGAGWKWHVGGSIVAALFDLPKQTLRADASNGEFRFSLQSKPPLAWSLPGATDVLSLSFEGMAITLARDAVSKKTEWSFECTGGLQLALLPRVSGTLGLYFENGRRGFVFTADSGQGELDLTLPLVPGDPRMTMGCRFKANKLSLLKTKEWVLSAESSVTWVVPKPAAPDSSDPVDRALKILGDMFALPTTAALAATSSGVSLIVADLPQVPVPVPVLVGHELVWDRLGSVGLARLELKVGKTVSGKGKFKFVVPEEVNNIFGQDHGKPKTRVFNSEWMFGLTVDEKWGLSLQVESLPINLEATTYFKNETENGRTWQRFTLGDVFSFRHGIFDDPEEFGQQWIHVDLFDMGEFRFRQPSFSFNGTDFSARVDVDMVRELRIPTAPLRWLLTAGNLQDLADVLPTHVALLDVHILDPVTKNFDPTRFVATLKALGKAMGTELPGLAELQKIANVLAGQFNLLPQDFRSYLDITIPKRLDVSIAVTPATGFGVKFDISAPREPLQFLIPHMLAVFGVTIRQLSFGEILNGSVLLVAADLDVDCFDLPSLVASLVLPAEVSRELTETPSIQRKFIVGNLLCLVVYETAVPIPIPVWFDRLGFKHHGLEGVRGQLVLGNNLAGITVGKVLKGLGGLFREFRRFFTEVDYALPLDLFARNNLNLGVNVSPGFVQLPMYLGGALLGSEQELFNLGADQLLVPIVNFFKQPDLGKLLAVIPLERRHGSVGVDSPLRIGPFEPEAAWLLSTTSELDRLVRDRGSQRNSFVDSLYVGGDSQGNALVRVLKGTALEAASGAVLFLRGRVALSDQLILDMVTGTVVTPAGITTGVAMHARLASLFDLKVAGDIRLRSSAGNPEFGLAGACSLTLLDTYPVLQGAVSMALAQQSNLRFDGLLDLFPDALFPARSRVQLYSGTRRGQKSRITGIVDARGINVGTFLPDGSVSAAGIHLEIGDFHLAGTTRIVSTAARQEWELELQGFGARLALSATGSESPEGRELRFAVCADQALDVNGVLGVFGTGTASGPSGSLALTIPSGSDRPALRELRFDGVVALLGLRSTAKVNVDVDRFDFDLASDLGILSTHLQVTGRRLDDVAGWQMNGRVDLLQGAAALQVNLKAAHRATFTGTGHLEFWGAKRLDLELTASTVSGGPNIRAVGTLDLRLPGSNVGLVSRLSGSITKDALALGGDVALDFFELHAHGKLKLEGRAGEGLKLGGRLSFATGLLGGLIADVSAAWKDGALELQGKCAATLRLLPGVFELAAASEVVITASAQPRLHLKGAVQLLGVKSTYDLEIAKGSFSLTSTIALAPIIVSLAVQSQNLANAGDLTISGEIQIGRLNDAIREFFDRIFGRSVDTTGAQLQSSSPTTVAKLAFLREMNKRWGSNGIDPDGYYYCIPPADHVEFWSESRWWWMFGIPRYSKEDVADIKQYYRYAAELGIDVPVPRRHDVARLLGGVIQAIADKLAELMAFVLTIESITFSEVPLFALRSARIAATVRFTLLGTSHEQSVVLDLSNPVGSLLENLRAVFPPLVQGAIPSPSALRSPTGLAEPVRVDLPSLGLIDQAAGRSGSWASETSWQIDLGQARSLNAVHLLIERSLNAPVDFMIRGSKAADMQDCVQIGGSADAEGPPHCTFSFDVVDARPLQYLSVTTNAPRSFDVGQLRAYARPSDLAARKPASASSSTDGYEPERANDGLSCATGGWEASGATNDYWQVDLGDAFALSYIELVTRQHHAMRDIVIGNEVYSADSADKSPSFVDAGAERRNFEIRASNRSDMGQDYVVLARQGANALEFKGVFRAFVEDQTPYRYIRVQKTVQERFFIAQLRVYELPSSPALAVVYSPGRKSEVFFAAIERPLCHAYDDDGAVLDTGSFIVGGLVSAVYSPQDEHSEVFLRGADGLLHHFHMSGDQWVHDHTSFVEGGQVRGHISAVYAAQRNHSELFFRGMDGYVHCFWYVEGRWRHDIEQFRRLGRSVGALSAAFSPTRRHVELFAVGEDGYLHYMCAPNGNWAHDATSFRAAGKVAGAVSAVFSPFANHTEVYLRGSDGNLHFYFARNAAWYHHCAELGADRVSGDICAIYVPTRNHSEVFFQGGDGLLHHCRFTADGWRHDGSSFRAAGRVRGRIAALFDEARERVEVYCTGEDGGLHRFVEESGAWKHELRPAPRPTLGGWRTPTPVAGSPLWRPGFAVRYAVEYEYADGSVARSAWWRGDRLDGEGYGSNDCGLPQVRIPCDPLEQVVARRMVRQFRGLPARVVARLANNTDQTWTDTDLGAVDASPPPPTFNYWQVALLPTGSPTWRAGFGVRYAVEFEYPDGTVGRSGWWSEGVYYESTYALPHMNIPRDPTDQIVARRVIREFRGLPERVVARIANNTDSMWTDVDMGIADMPPPPPPSVIFWSETLPVAGSPVWQPGTAVRYAVEYEYVDGTVVRGGWGSTTEQDAEGYTAGGSALPTLSIPCDPTDTVAARRVIRQFRGLPERMIARITDNTDPAWADTDLGTADMPPAAPRLRDWYENLPLGSSPTWIPPYGVRYAVEFEYADGTVVRSGWWRAVRQDGEGYGSHDYALAQLDIPCDPSSQIVARRIVRQFRGLPERMIARIANNTDPTWTDTDRGTADMPPPPPTIKSWSALLPLASSPVWQPGFGVRYAVAYEYADGTVVRSSWWQAQGQAQDGDGYVSSPGHALPVVNLPSDPTGQIVARQIIRQFRGLPERMITRIADNEDSTWCDTDRGTADMPPAPPMLNWWAVKLPLGSSPTWIAPYGVRYAVEFEYPDGTIVRSAWWHAVRQDNEGYGSHDYALPQMSIPCDPSGQIAARRIVRQFRGLPERTIARIENNTDPTWMDMDRGTADMPPRPPTLHRWSSQLPLAASPVWQPGFSVRYAVAYEYADGTVVRSDWWKAEGQAQDGESYVSSPEHTLPVVSVPIDPTGQIVARHMLRQFRGLPERMIARIADNTDPTWMDTDRGTADMPPPPPTVDSWSANLPVAGSPVWQPGFRVRYAVAYEYADGTIVRSCWWSDGEGFEGFTAHAMPVLNISRDPTGQVVARRMIRQFHGLPERVVARIIDPGATMWGDSDHGVADMPPPPPPTVDCWAASLPVAGSPVWQPGFRVRYAVAYEYADGTVVRSRWWGSPNGEGYEGSGHTLPVLYIPRDPTGQVVARHMIRQFDGLLERVVARIADPSATTWRDSDHGVADMPPPSPPTINCWATNLPVAGSPVWQPGFRVRYAVAYEYADGTLVRSRWWSDGDGFDGSTAYAMPVVNIPRDPTGQVVARHMIRQFDGLPERVVARVSDPGATMWGDSDSGIADMPPPPPPSANVWHANLPVAGSPVWQPGFAVRYAVAYEYADGTVVRSAWWHAEYPDAEGYGTRDYALPNLNIPCDPTGAVVARQIVRQFRGLPERMIARIANNTDKTWTDADSGVADMPPPPPPSAEVWSANLPVAGSPLWQPGFRVRYAVAYEYADGTVVRSAWWHAEYPDAEGYGTREYALPNLNIPCDPTGQVVARQIVRQFRGLPERRIARIANNTETTWTDADVGFVDLPPPPSANVWHANLPVAGSPLWQPGFRVRYAVAYEYADGTVVRSGWWHAEYPDAEGYGTREYALPNLNIPCDPTGAVVARQIVRQFRGLPERRIARIANNTDTTWTDADMGFVDLPPPPSANVWHANLPVAGSPVWQPEFRVRYAVAYEYADGTVVRSGWWHAEYPDGEGYGTRGYALPNLNIPCDPTGAVVARQIVRQFRGLPERMITRIANNTDTTWTDADSGIADMPPPPPPSAEVWSANLPVAGSPVWQPGFAVRYAVTYEYADGTVVRSGWWHAEYPDAEGYGTREYALPNLNIPCDPTGAVVARQIVRQFRGLPERMIARIANNTDTTWTDADVGFVDMPPPPSANVWCANLPVAGSPLWQPGLRVRYAMAYEYADGTVVRSAWWHAEYPDAEGYGTREYALPNLNIPCDPTGAVVARQIVRQFRGLPERIIARIDNNTDTTWTDADVGFVDLPPPPSANVWHANLPVAGSPLWQPGFQVRYAVAYEYADGTVVRSAWWHAEYPDAEGYGTRDYALPNLNIPCDPTGAVVARQIVRQFRGLPERMIARIANNTDTTWTDADSGIADMPPPPPPTINVWAANLPLAGSPLWQPGFRVRYAVAFEYADGTLVRSGWWHTQEPQDDAGYTTGAYALPVLHLPRDPSGTVVARHILRQFRSLPERMVARIANNTELGWSDADNGASDVAPPINVAPGKLAAASSEWSAEHSASHANPVVHPGSGGWSPRGEPEQHWWQVDLGQPHHISRIELVTRQEGDQPDTRRNFALWLSNHPDMRDHVVVGQQDEVSLPFQATFTAVVSTPTHYRYVRAIKTIAEYFFIGELRVFAEPVSVPRVTVFEHGDYQGQSQTLEPGYHAGPLAVGNNAVSSVRVPPGYRVTLYEHGPGTGRQRVLTADAPVLPDFNDITSNILVERILQRWVFVQGMDSPGGDIGNLGGNKPSDAMIAIADATPGCIAFNTAGYYKNVLLPPEQWRRWGDDPAQGMWVLRRWVFVQGMDSPGGDIGNLGGNKPSDAMIAVADATPGCIAFNTAGYYKNVLLPPEQWRRWGDDPAQGMWVLELSGVAVPDFPSAPSPTPPPPQPLNVAPGKPAAASSEWSAEHSAGHANPVVHPGSGGWSPRGEPEQHWWQVDLGRPHHISRIELVTRQEGDQPDTRRNFALWLANEPDMSDHVVVGQQDEVSLPFQATFTAVVSTPTHYRYARAIKTIAEYFFIGELRVFAEQSEEA